MYMKIKTKSIKQIVLLNATPAEVYDMFMDSKKHGAFTGSPARMSRKIDGTFTAYGGWIKGKNLKLTAGRLIIQEWRGDDWPKGHYSKAMFLLTKHPRGTKLTFGQTGVPAQFYADIKGGWKTEYWDKMKKMIAENKKKAIARHKS